MVTAKNHQDLSDQREKNDQTDLYDHSYQND